MYTCRIRINAKLVKEGSFRINAKLVKEELSNYLNPLDLRIRGDLSNYLNPIDLRIRGGLSDYLNPLDRGVPTSAQHLMSIGSTIMFQCFTIFFCG